MAQLVIKGHQTRGKEVIEILKMLGGKTHTTLRGNLTFRAYYIKADGFIDYKHHSVFDKDIMYSLEEFLERFPYKVGDKVWLHYENLNIRTLETIICMHWDNKYNCILYDVATCCNLKESAFTPYKEETMEENTDTTLSIDLKLKGEDYSDKRFCYKIPNGYEIDCVKNNEIILKPIKLQYPKTYEECCKRLNILSDGNIVYAGSWAYGGEYLEKHLDRLRNFQQLLLCRDTYWKVAGDEMGLDKLWKPYNGQESCKKYVIQTVYGKVTCLDTWCQTRNILEFPTAEIRDNFYENFKELIELCKELL